MKTSMQKTMHNAAAAATALVMLTLALPIDAQRSDVGGTLDTAVTIASGGRVNLGVTNGSITVTASTDGRVRVTSRSGSGRVNFTATSSSVTAHGRFGGDTHLQVAVPAGVRVMTESASGNTSIRGVRGDVTINGMSGTIEVADITGRVTVQNLSGSATIGTVTGAVRANVVSGTLTLNNIDGTVEAETVSGDVRMTNIRTQNVRAASVSGNITYSGSFDRSGSYLFDSHSGNVRLTLPAGTGATVSMESFSGTLRSDFPMQLEPGVTQRGERRVFTIGGGGTSITVRSFSGNIIIERGSDREEN
jgi:hypothetical protein